MQKLVLNIGMEEAGFRESGWCRKSGPLEFAPDQRENTGLSAGTVRVDWDKLVTQGRVGGW